MQFLVTAKQVEISDDVREYAESKCGKLTKYTIGIETIEAIFSREADLFAVEIIVRDDHNNTFVSQESGPDTFALIDAIVDKLERQLRKHKDQLRDHHNSDAPKLSGLD